MGQHFTLGAGPAQNNYGAARAAQAVWLSPPMVGKRPEL